METQNLEVDWQSKDQLQLQIIFLPTIILLRVFTGLISNCIAPL